MVEVSPVIALSALRGAVTIACMDDLTTAEKAELRKALSLAIATGAQSVTFRDRTISYRSVAEMRTVLDMLGDAPSFADRHQTAVTKRGTEGG